MVFFYPKISYHPKIFLSRFRVFHRCFIGVSQPNSQRSALATSVYRSTQRRRNTESRLLQDFTCRAAYHLPYNIADCRKPHILEPRSLWFDQLARSTQFSDSALLRNHIVCLLRIPLSYGCIYPLSVITKIMQSRQTNRISSSKVQMTKADYRIWSDPTSESQTNTVKQSTDDNKRHFPSSGNDI